MKFICKYIETKAAEANLDTSNRKLSNVRRMFEAAGLDKVVTNRRGDQLVMRNDNTKDTCCTLPLYGSSTVNTNRSEEIQV